MTDDERIGDLLIEWEERFERGDDLPAEVLCRSCPDLIERVAEAIRELKGTAWMSRAPAYE